MRITFESEGETLVGNLFLPDAKPAGAVTPRLPRSPPRPRVHAARAATRVRS
jgi:hypothetical protein